MTPIPNSIDRSIFTWMALREISFNHEGKNLLLVYYKRILPEDNSEVPLQPYSLDDEDKMLYLSIKKIDPSARIVNLLLTTEGEQISIKMKYLGFPIGKLHLVFEPIEESITPDLERYQGKNLGIYHREYPIHVIGSSDLSKPILNTVYYPISEADSFNYLLHRPENTIIFL